MTTRTRIFDSFCRRRRGRKGTVSLSVSVVVAFLYCCLAFSSAAETSASTSSSSNDIRRQVRVFNESPFRIELFLEDDDNQLVSPQEGVLPGGTWKWDVTVGQRYTVYELPDEDTGLCQEQEEEEDDDSACWKTSFVITNGQEQGKLNLFTG